MRTLGIRKADLKLNDCEKPLFLDVVNNAVDRVGLTEMLNSQARGRLVAADSQVHGHWELSEAPRHALLSGEDKVLGGPGGGLVQEVQLIRTSKIYQVPFFRFRDECPNGRLSRLHLITLFGKIFPEGKNILLRILYEFVEGNATKITSHIFRIFDSDGNDYLDFKEYLMAIDIANRDTGWS